MKITKSNFRQQTLSFTALRKANGGEDGLLRGHTLSYSRKITEIEELIEFNLTNSILKKNPNQNYDFLLIEQGNN
ncbi:hypothetical protein BpHYR1_014697 [Brachionus plicatilis]|uniref:Uncharacterized protein n=1 Tax=Brachionus plicatilis TaxID=10195 RepID=A0A3M7RHY7_BRAPC|nr:hypothetical protein BpHYR1_014697 [Brachionus plicatilis]